MRDSEGNGMRGVQVKLVCLIVQNNQTPLWEYKLSLFLYLIHAALIFLSHGFTSAWIPSMYRRLRLSCKLPIFKDQALFTRTNAVGSRQPRLGSSSFTDVRPTSAEVSSP